jgi:hypothetical protein
MLCKPSPISSIAFPRFIADRYYVEQTPLLHATAHGRAPPPVLYAFFPGNAGDLPAWNGRRFSDNQEDEATNVDHTREGMGQGRQHGGQGRANADGGGRLGLGI